VSDKRRRQEIVLKRIFLGFVVLLVLVVSTLWFTPGRRTSEVERSIRRDSVPADYALHNDLRVSVPTPEMHILAQPHQ
jgi:hypothetical protein